MFLNNLKNRIKNLFFNKKKDFFNKCEIYRRMWENRKNALIEEKKIISKCRIILGNEQIIRQKAEYWKAQENQERYETDALLAWEFYSTIEPKERELIEKGARLREKFYQECVKYIE